MRVSILPNRIAENMRDFPISQRKVTSCFIVILMDIEQNEILWENVVVVSLNQLSIRIIICNQETLHCHYFVDLK